MSACVCVCVCVPPSDSSETVQTIIIKLGTETASDITMHHVLIIVNLTFVQGHSDLNHENNICFTHVIMITISRPRGGFPDCLSKINNSSPLVSITM